MVKPKKYSSPIEISRVFDNQISDEGIGRKIKRLNSRIHENKWYILDFNNPLNPKVLGRFYESRLQAKGIIDNHFGGKYTHIIPISGSELISYFIKWDGISMIIPKYDYPEDCITRQQKKTYRTQTRKRIRAEIARKRKEWHFNKVLPDEFYPEDILAIRDKFEKAKAKKNFAKMIRRKYYRTLV